MEEDEVKLKKKKKKKNHVQKEIGWVSNSCAEGYSIHVTPPCLRHYIRLLLRR
ncbi:unnamed protein product [Arabidopsis halleri]